MTITVFIADDHALVCDGLRQLLAPEADITVVGVATNGRDAVTEISRMTPNVALMDIAMPDLNGIEAANQINQLSPDSSVIILTMHATNQHIFRALQAGAAGYLLKDSAGVEVIAAVRAVAAGRRYFSPQIADRLTQIRLDQSKSPLDLLSPRERQIMQMVVESKTSAEIAQILGLSPKTVETYRSRLTQKLGVESLPALVKFAIQHGLTPLE